MNSVTSRPAGRRPTFFTEEKIHPHHHRRNHEPDERGYRGVNLTSPAELDTAQARDGAGQELP